MHFAVTALIRLLQVVIKHFYCSLPAVSQGKGRANSLTAAATLVSTLHFHTHPPPCATRPLHLKLAFTRKSRRQRRNSRLSHRSERAERRRLRMSSTAPSAWLCAIGARAVPWRHGHFRCTRGAAGGGERDSGGASGPAGLLPFHAGTRCE